MFHAKYRLDDESRCLWDLDHRRNRRLECLFCFQDDLNPVDTDDSSSNVFRLLRPTCISSSTLKDVMDDFNLAPPGWSDSSQPESNDMLPSALLEAFLCDVGRHTHDTTSPTLPFHSA